MRATTDTYHQDPRITKVPGWYWVRLRSDKNEYEWDPRYILHEIDNLYEPCTMSLEETMWDHFDVVGPISEPSEEYDHGYDEAARLIDDPKTSGDNEFLWDVIDIKLMEIFEGFKGWQQRAVFVRTLLIHLMRNLKVL